MAGIGFKPVDAWMFDSVMEGLLIIRKYCKKDASMLFDKDELHAGSIEASPDKMLENDVKRLKELHWHWDEHWWTCYG